MAYKRKDFYYRQAKRQAYRSRAAFKLIELDEKFNVLKPGNRVVDLGAWPGGWLQVASAAVGANGRVVGVDLARIEPLAPNVKTLQRDVAAEGLATEIVDLLGGLADVVLSDMAPKLSGVAPTDAARARALAETSFRLATELLRDGGSYLCKLFDSPDAEEFARLAGSRFRSSLLHRPCATRSRSSEIYLLARGFKVGSRCKEG